MGMVSRTLERAALVVRRDLTLGTLFDRLERVHGDRRLVTESDGGLDLTYRRPLTAFAAGPVASPPRPRRATSS